MGIYDRGYYDGDAWKGGSENDGRSGFKRSAVATIILINVAIFVVDMFSPKVAINDIPIEDATSQQVSVTLALKYGLAEQGYPGPAENPLYFYQLLTYGFAHASIGDDFGLMHVAFNMLMLFFLGVPVEQKYGKAEFTKFYILAVIFSGAIWLIAKVITGQPQLAVGASGAVVAVVILFVLNYPKQKLLLMGIIPMPAWVLGLFMVGLDLFNSFSTETRIAFEAHLAGALFAAMYFYGKWNFEWLRLGNFGKRLSRKPRLKVHSPDDADPTLAKDADEILDKLHREGEDSLSRKERKILEKFSRSVRKNRDS